MTEPSRRTYCLLKWLFVLNIIWLASAQSTFFEISSPWVWTCKEKKCLRTRASETTQGQSNAVCKLTCYDSATLWPLPTGETTLSKDVSAFFANDVRIAKLTSNSTKTEDMLKEAAAIFSEHIKQMENNGLGGSTRDCSVSANTCASAAPYSSSEHLFNVEVIVTQNIAPLALDTDESYTLDVKTTNSVTTAYIVAETFFGARHAMETLSQLITWDELSNSLVVIQNAHIEDSPVFPHRGFAVDTARNYMEISLIKRIIDGLSYNKLNVLHWHMSDSNSFPFVSTREPLMAIYGAPSARKVYRPAEVQELVHYAQVRGVKIIPELDAPSHVGAGWDWGPLYGMGDLIICLDKQPWDEYCAQPPCGIFDPTNDKIYTVLKNIYKDMDDVFQSDMFHMGGDEVNMRCWNESESIKKWLVDKGWNKDPNPYLKLWSYFQNQSLAKLDEAHGRTQPVIIWNSDLTAKEHAKDYLDPNRYIIQYWNTWNNSILKDLYEDGYKLIISNYDALYLDCGYGSWVGNGLNNWCPQYTGWKLIYENSPRVMIQNFSLPYNKDQILGGEAALWAEQSQGGAIEGKLWPRLSALAERLWTDPDTKWFAAETRLHIQRERMVERGITADALQPEWCVQNDGSCIL
ncbi:hypothetical protein DAPPUDRAFT_309875 [Daphnia pulex]|uniref:Beta-hexosaminidase n=1 Tax=Daphnia pulex TaxID=6669 RepID=E9FR17_DAPPU|nr:hypothetical protein DAPPUDRAFT_309875 [Daphnia pulex]|eukprot:EFX90079.1 hypothetical protein DAPPUDRAFT_309875 [Daphnia pulex]